MNYYSRHIGDYLKDTAHLSLLEHGIYGRLLDVYYTRERGFTFDEAARLIGAKSDDERKVLADILNDFFVLAESVYSQTRCDREIEICREKSSKAKASADKRWTHTERNANAMRTHSEGNAPNSQEPITNTVAIATVVSPKARPAKRCPESFLVTPELQQWARQSAPLVDIRAETATFRDYEFGKTASDWPARWRVWMSKEQKRLAETAKRNSSGETVYQRSMRERVAEIHPALARKAPGIAPNPMDTIDALIRTEPARLAR